MTRPLEKTVTDRPAGFQRAAFEAFLETRDEPGWITDLRRKAFALYSERLEIPLDPEEFKRVDLRAFRPDNYRIGHSPANPLSPRERVAEGRVRGVARPALRPHRPPSSPPCLPTARNLPAV